MATGEDQAQPVVRNFAIRSFREIEFFSGLDRDFLFQQILLFAPRAFAPARGDQFAAGRGPDPGGRVLRNAALGPMAPRRGQRLLHGLLGAIEGAAQPDQTGDDPAMLAAKHRFDRRANFSELQHWSSAK